MPRSVRPVSGPPLFNGAPVLVRYRAGLRDSAGNPAHAATSILGRQIFLDPELKRMPGEHRRILLHEYFHFVWVRLGNQRRWAWEEYLRNEWNSGAKGEAGWSAEWRKRELSAGDVAARTRRWREYCCESFCDTAASIYNRRGAKAGSEVTLSAFRQRARLVWFRTHAGGSRFPI